MVDMPEFKNKVSYNSDNVNNICNMSMLEFKGELTPVQIDKLNKIKIAWNFYEGYHWEGIPQTDKPQMTENYCRPFVNKFVSFELGNNFTINVDKDTLAKFGKDQQTNLDFLNEVWKNSRKDALCIELGQSKSITGDGWLQIKYFSKDELDDPFEEYPDGKLCVMVIPTSIIFPTYDTYDKSKLVKVSIMYPIEKVENSLLFKKPSVRKIVYKQIWTKDEITILEDDKIIQQQKNPYGILPFVQIKNYPIAGRSDGAGDLDDLIPLNTELNFKKSDVSEIIDYHSAPITVVFGAKINDLERGANKVWGGLPKDAKVENLELNSDLGASTSYIEDIKQAMHDIGGVPKGALGGEQAISNTSGVALQFMNMPLIDRNKIKKSETTFGLQLTNKIILLMGIHHKLIKIPNGITPKEFYDTEVVIKDNLPKDTVLQLQEIETKMRLGIQSKKGAMRELGVENINDVLEEVQEEKIDDAELNYKLTVIANPVTQNLEGGGNQNNPQGNTNKPQTSGDNEAKFKNSDGMNKKLNSGMNNGNNNKEIVRKEVKGVNKK